MTVQTQIVDLLRDLQRRHGLGYLFISHDLKVVRAMAHRLIVMRHGEVVESGPADDLFDRPRTDYARALMAAAFEMKAMAGVSDFPSRPGAPAARDWTAGFQAVRAQCRASTPADSPSPARPSRSHDPSATRVPQTG